MQLSPSNFSFNESCSCVNTNLEVDYIAQSNSLLQLFHRSTQGQGYTQKLSEMNFQVMGCCENEIAESSEPKWVVSNPALLGVSSQSCGFGKCPSEDSLIDMAKPYLAASTRYLTRIALTGIPSNSTIGVATHPNTIQMNATSTDLGAKMSMAILNAASYGDKVAILAGSQAFDSLTTAGMTLSDAMSLVQNCEQKCGAKVMTIPGLTGITVIPVGSVVLHVQEWILTQNQRWICTEAKTEESTWLRTWYDSETGTVKVSMLFGGVSNVEGSTLIKVI